MNIIKKKEMKSVKSIYPCKSVIQTIYDIVKAHGGELKVETKEARPPMPVRTGMTRYGWGEGSEFIILLPVI